MALTAEQLALIRGLQGPGYNPGYATSGGYVYQPQYRSSGQGETFEQGPLEAIVSYKEGAGIGDPWETFDPQGNFLSSGVHKDADMSLAEMAAIIGASALGFNALGGLIGPGATWGGAGAGAAGSGAGFVGEGAVSGIPGWDAALASASPGMGAAGAGAAGGLGSALRGAGSLLGPAATALGALAGAQGQEQSQNQTRKMDPRFDPYYFGDQGLLSMGMNLLKQQQADPAGWNQMKSAGLGLLSGPVAGNGFAMFRGR